MDDDRSLFFTYALQWAPILPLLLTYLIGLLIALLTWQKHRTASALTLSATLLLALAAAVGPIGSIYLTTLVATEGWTVAQLGYAQLVFHAVLSLVQAIGVALLLTAVFYRRPSAVTPSPSAPPLLPIS